MSMTKEEAINELNLLEMFAGTPKAAEAVRLATAALREREEALTNCQQWIPVTERLPEDDLPKDSKVKRIKVLVAYKTNGILVTRTQIRAKGYWYGAPDKWSWVKISAPITHWMPLPEPPKEDTK